MYERFMRAGMLLGEENMQKLWSSHVAVLGLGGVGSWCAEALARSGVGRLTLVDEDIISESNINRQIIALSSTIAESKADVMARRVRDISPHCDAAALTARYEAEARDAFSLEAYDYIIDAIDLVTCKVDLIATAIEKNVPIISALGTGNKYDASLLQISDISKTKGCPLARVVRKELRRRGIKNHKVVFSPELPAAPDIYEEPAPGRRSVPGSLIWVPATAGLLLAQAVVLELTNQTAKRG